MSSTQKYIYRGPTEYHAMVGQVMAYLGFTGGRLPGLVEAVVLIKEENHRFFLHCLYGHDEMARSFVGELKTSLIGQEIKRYLLHWYDTWQGVERGRWGILIGVRPTKLVHHLLDKGLDEKQVQYELVHTYEVDAELASQLVRMAVLQQPYIKVPANQVSIYVGIPYCSSHCLYCSFPSRLVQQNVGIPSFIDALVQDIDDWGSICRQYGLHVHSIYVGGGTPTCLPVQALQNILCAIKEAFPNVQEWTVEAGRPDTASLDKLTLLAECGVHRISVNPQTMQQSLLDYMGRKHVIEDVYRMYEQCRALHFSIINMDFIAGLPRQTVADMQENMKIVCQLLPENVTIHTLALKKQAPLFSHPLRQEIPSEAIVTDMLACCHHTLKDAGYIPYYLYRQKYMATGFANIGYAQPGTVSAYNIEMMEERQNIFAVGPGGATKLITGKYTLAKMYQPKDIDRYIQELPETIKERHRLCADIWRRG